MLKLNKMNISKNETKEFIALSPYLLGKNNDSTLAYTFIQRELYFVKSFRAKLLLNISIINI